MSEPIELYFWPTPNGWKISIALEEMKLAYVLKPVAIGRGDQFKPEFLAISPNNRMPAIVDPDGPDGRPISIFESAAILQYLGRKTGQLYARDERGRVEVEQWLAWQVANLGPIAGQVSHFVNYAPKLIEDETLIAYAKTRYVNELNRLCGVMERRLADRPFLAGDYSIADIASWPWARVVHRLGQSFDDFPKLKDWVDRIYAREPVQKALKAGEELRQQELSRGDVQAMAKTLFGQTAASVAQAASERKH